MEKINVFLDLDGVMCDFDGKLHEVFGKKYDEIKHEMHVNDIWDKLGDVDHLFLHLKPLPHSKTLFNYLKSLHDKGEINRFEILTSLPYSTNKLVTSKQDKIDWVREHLDKDIIVNTVVGGEKKAKFVTGPNDILIDDLERNIQAWEKAGGTGIHFNTNGKAITRLDQILHLSLTPK